MTLRLGAPRAIRRWPAAVTALALCASLAAPAFAISSSIHLRSGAIGPMKTAVPRHLEAQGEARRVMMVKFPGPLTAEQRAALEALTERVYTYLPDHAYLVRLPAGSDGERLRALGAEWLAVYHPAYKMGPAVAAADLYPGRGVQKANALRSVLLHVFPDADITALRQELRALGVERIVGAKAMEPFSRIRLLLTNEEIIAHREGLARLDGVFWIDAEARRVLLNDTTIWVGQSGLGGGQATPIFDQGIFGEGQIVGVLDTGIDPDMCYFRDDALGLPPINPCDGGTLVDPAQRKVVAVNFLWSNECSGGISNSEWDTHDHGSHVAGTVAGDNLGNLTHETGDGMAPGAKLVIQDGGFSTDNCADLPGIGCPVVDLNPIFQQAYDQGARIHTNSWGDRENFNPHNTYSAGSEDADEFMWNHKDFLIFVAAGNDGPGAGTVGSPTTAKNVVSVGATNRGTSAETLASFSSCGPTEDGRLKPDVTAPGVSIVSANNDLNAASNNCGTRTMSGTSMASPAAAGLGALVRQYYADGFYPSGVANGGDAFTPSAALVKATLVNSAREMTGASAIPSTCQGWGRILLDDALAFPGDSRQLWVHDEATGFNSGGTQHDFTFAVAAGESLKVTLAWTDFPSTPAAATNLVNDLDLTVVGPGGTYRGNVFSGGNSIPGGSADRLNNLEQVLLAAPAAGSYTVTVSAFNVPSGPQDYALVVSGDAVEAPACTATCGNGVIECNEVCDGGALGGATCGDFGCGGGGTLVCNTGCDGFDTGLCFGCPVCDNDGVCELGEDCENCASDCASGSTSGASCGNGICEAGDGENCVSCAADCNGVQGGKPNGRYCCGDGGGSNPIPCSDSRCSTGGVTCTDTPSIPGSFCCGLLGCETGEGCGNCALDCATGAEVCTDGADNDCDGDIDCADLDCLGDPVCDPGSCGQSGDSCSVNGDCCSGNCKGNGVCK
jgi:hypothetical protein